MRINVGLVVRPFTNGRELISSISDSSAPSAKSFTRSSSIFGMADILSQNDSRRIEQGPDSEVVGFRPALPVPPVEKEGAAPGTPPRFDVAPAVPDQMARAQIEGELGCGARDESRHRLAARTRVPIVVHAHVDSVEPQ